MMQGWQQHDELVKSIPTAVSPAPLSPFRTVEEAALYLRVSTKTVRRRIDSGALKASQPGGDRTKLLIHLSDLDKYAFGGESNQEKFQQAQPTASNPATAIGGGAGTGINLGPDLKPDMFTQSHDARYGADTRIAAATTAKANPPAGTLGTPPAGRWAGKPFSKNR